MTLRDFIHKKFLTCYFLKGKQMKKAKFILTMYLGDTKLDVHGSYEQIEEIYLSGTDYEISELIHSLNWDKFEDQFKEVYFYSQRG
jgi:hypothetical protein